MSPNVGVMQRFSATEHSRATRGEQKEAGEKSAELRQKHLRETKKERAKEQVKEGRAEYTWTLQLKSRSNTLEEHLFIQSKLKSN